MHKHRDKMIKMLLLIGTGSFIGGVLRFLLGLLINGKNPSLFPWGTLTVNVLGCFLIGCLFGWIDKSFLNLDLRMFLITGFLGGFTTFSTFSNETLMLFRTGAHLHALGYLFFSVFAGLTATYLGYVILKGSSL